MVDSRQPRPPFGPPKRSHCLHFCRGVPSGSLMTVSGHAEQREGPTRQALERAKRMAEFALAAYHPDIKLSGGGRWVSDICRLPKQMSRKAANMSHDCTGAMRVRCQHQHTFHNPQLLSKQWSPVNRHLRTPKHTGIVEAAGISKEDLL